jgi:hypothetical protein
MACCAGSACVAFRKRPKCSWVTGQSMLRDADSVPGRPLENKQYIRRNVLELTIKRKSSESFLRKDQSYNLAPRGGPLCTGRHGAIPASVPCSLCPISQLKAREKKYRNAQNSFNASLFVYIIKSSPAGFRRVRPRVLTASALAYASRAFDFGIAFIPTVAGEASGCIWKT